MILGFGSTEKAKEQEIGDLLVSFVKEKFSESDDSYFTDDLKEQAKKFAKELEDEHRARDAEYKTAPTYPDRYSTFWVRVLNDASNMVFIVSFLHTNRRHALSPDGWAALSTEEIFNVNCGDIQKKKAA